MFVSRPFINQRNTLHHTQQLWLTSAHHPGCNMAMCLNETPFCFPAQKNEDFTLFDTMSEVTSDELSVSVFEHHYLHHLSIESRYKCSPGLWFD